MNLSRDVVFDKARYYKNLFRKKQDAQVVPKDKGVEIQVKRFSVGQIEREQAVQNEDNGFSGYQLGHNYE